MTFHVLNYEIIIIPGRFFVLNRNFSKQIENKTTTPVNSFFDLQGRRLDGQPRNKGIYIQNGKKVVVK